MLIQYTFMYNTLGIGRELYRSVVFAYVVVVKLPLGWGIIFSKIVYTIYVGEPELGVTGSLGVIVCVG